MGLSCVRKSVTSGPGGAPWMGVLLRALPNTKLVQHIVMKSLKFLLLLGLSAIAAQAANNSPMADWPKAYSVEMETTASGMKSTTKMFVDGDKMRTDMDAGGMQMSTIIRKDKKVSYTLMHAQKMVMETALQDAPAAAAQNAPEPVWEKVGSATVNGQACTEYKMKLGADVTTFFINGDKLPVRMTNANMTMDYKNFKAGASDAALFEVPAGYSKPGEAPAASADNSSSSSETKSAAPAADEKPAKKKKGLGGMLGR